MNKENKEVKIMVGVPTSGFSRNDHFYDYYNIMQKLPGTPCMFARGQSPARNRNIIIEKAIELDCTHIFFLDDDVIPPIDAIPRLLAHDKDIVTGLYLMRNYPNNPIIFDQSFDNGKCKTHFLQDSETGLIPIVNCGLGLVLIKIEVFKAIEKPWIRLGETEIDHWGDDIGFFNRVRKVGFSLYCDLSIQGGHMATVTVKPVYKDGKWYTQYDTNNDNTGALFPAVRPTPEQIREAVARELQEA